MNKVVEPYARHKTWVGAAVRIKSSNVRVVGASIHSAPDEDFSIRLQRESVNFGCQSQIKSFILTSVEIEPDQAAREPTGGRPADQDFTILRQGERIDIIVSNHSGVEADIQAAVAVQARNPGSPGVVHGSEVSPDK